MLTKHLCDSDEILGFACLLAEVEIDIKSAARIIQRYAAENGIEIDAARAERIFREAESLYD